MWPTCSPPASAACILEPVVEHVRKLRCVRVVVACSAPHSTKALHARAWSQPSNLCMPSNLCILTQDADVALQLARAALGLGGLLPRGVPLPECPPAHLPQRAHALLPAVSPPQLFFKGVKGRRFISTQLCCEPLWHVCLGYAHPFNPDRSPVSASAPWPLRKGILSFAG